MRRVDESASFQLSSGTVEVIIEHTLDWDSASSGQSLEHNWEYTIAVDLKLFVESLRKHWMKHS